MTDIRSLSVVFAPQNYRYRQKVYPGLPILVDREGVIWEVQRYICHLALFKKRSIGTLKNEIYILKSWLAFLRNKSFALHEASDDLISDFISSKSVSTLSGGRIGRIVSVIFRFYVFSSRRYIEYTDVIEDPLNGRVGLHYPISVEICWKRTKGGITPLYRSNINIDRSSGSLPRPTPDEHEAELIQEHLDSATISGELKFARSLMVGWMYYSTLRCEGVARLRVSSISHALAFHHITSENGTPYDLESLLPEERGSILDGIAELRATGRDIISVEVMEKRRKVRKVPLRLDHLEYNLHFIWNLRPRILRGRVSEALFPSSKTGGHLRPGSIGNLVKLAFVRAQVAGSAHRLRAACLERVTREAFLRHLAAHGSGFDRAAVLMEVAELAGHDRVATLKPYLNRLMSEFARHIGEPVLVRNVVIAKYLRGLLERVEQDDALTDALYSFFEHHNITPIERLAVQSMATQRPSVDMSPQGSVTHSH